MSNIEDLLAQSGSAKPRRQLRHDFTQQITKYIAANPRPRGLAHIKELLTMKLFTRPAIAVAAITVAIVASGTTYAAVGGWQGFSALFGGEQKVDGGRIVQVDTKDCLMPAPLSGASATNHYYKVKEHAQLSNEQIVTMVRGYCELGMQVQFEHDVLIPMLERDPQNSGGVFGSHKIFGGYVDSKVVAIDQSSITLESVVPHMSPSSYELKTIVQTFSRIDPQVLVYDGPHQIALQDITVGDHVAVKFRAAGNEGLANTAPSQLDPDAVAVVAIVKNSPNLSAAIDYHKYNNEAFEQIYPCDSQPDGYCTAEQYLRQQQ